MYLDLCPQSFYEDVEVDEIDEIETFLIDVAAGKVSKQKATSSVIDCLRLSIPDTSRFCVAIIQVPVQGQGFTHTASRIWQRLVEFFPYSLVLLIPIALLLSTCFMPSLWTDPMEEKLREAKEGAEAAVAEHLRQEGKDDDDDEDDGGDNKHEEPKDATLKKTE